MPLAADYAIVRDSTITLHVPPPPAPGFFESGPFSMPGVDRTLSGILAFRANPSSNADIKFVITLNGVDIESVPVTFDTNPSRTWHEVVAGAALQANDNRLRIEVRPGGTGTVDLSDIVLWFRKNIP